MLIRHSLKEYNNKNTRYGLDPNLTPEGRELAKETFVSLLKDHPAPRRLIISPYRRTRQTAEELLNLIDDPPEIIVDTSIGEYLGMRSKVTREMFYPDTLDLFEPKKEDLFLFHQRIKDFCQRESENLKKGDTWVITHGFNITKIGLHFGMIIGYQKEMGIVELF